MNVHKAINTIYHLLQARYVFQHESQQVDAGQFRLFDDVGAGPLQADAGFGRRPALSAAFLHGQGHRLSSNSMTGFH